MRQYSHQFHKGAIMPTQRVPPVEPEEVKSASRPTNRKRSRPPAKSAALPPSQIPPVNPKAVSPMYANHQGIYAPGVTPNPGVQPPPHQQPRLMPQSPQQQQSRPNGQQRVKIRPMHGQVARHDLIPVLQPGVQPFPQHVQMHSSTGSPYNWNSCLYKFKTLLHIRDSYSDLWVFIKTLFCWPRNYNADDLFTWILVYSFISLYRTQLWIPISKWID